MDGSWQGRSRVVEAARSNFGQISDQRPEIESIASQGENIAVLFRESGALRSEGRAYRVRVVQWFTFSGGKVSRINEIVAITGD